MRGNFNKILKKHSSLKNLYMNLKTGVKFGTFLNLSNALTMRKKNTDFMELKRGSNFSEPFGTFPEPFLKIPKFRNFGRWAFGNPGENPFGFFCL